MSLLKIKISKIKAAFHFLTSPKIPKLYPLNNAPKIKQAVIRDSHLLKMEMK